MSEQELFGDNKHLENQGNEDKIESYLDNLVGEDKPFKDQEALAKGKYEADRFIGKLEEELSELREELSKRMSMEESVEKIVERIKKENHNKESSEDLQGHERETHSNEQDIPSKFNSEQDVLSLVEKAFEQKTKEATLQANTEKAVKSLKEAWGDTWQYNLNKRAEELGLDKEYLTGIARTNPDAFVKIVVGVTNTKPIPNSDTPPKSSSVSSDRGGSYSSSQDTKTFSFFQKMRKENPKAYFKVETQREMHRLAQQMGEAFYK